MPYENLSKRDADLPPVDVKQLLQLNQQLHQPPAADAAPQSVAPPP
jgi:hypothetical protein